MDPGMTRSRDSGGGAREAMVWVKERSCDRRVDMRELKRSSAMARWAWVKRRALLTWEASRSVGVGELVCGVLVAGAGLGGLRMRARSS